MSRSHEQRMEKLESRLDFQEDIIEHLNLVVARQDKEVLELKARLSALAARVNEFHEAAGAAGSAPDTELPPHY